MGVNPNTGNDFFFSGDIVYWVIWTEYVDYYFRDCEHVRIFAKALITMVGSKAGNTQINNLKMYCLPGQGGLQNARKRSAFIYPNTKCEGISDNEYKRLQIFIANIIWSTYSLRVDCISHIPIRGTYLAVIMWAKGPPR